MQKDQNFKGGTSLPNWVYRMYKISITSMSLVFVFWGFYTLFFQLIEGPHMNANPNSPEYILDKITGTLVTIIFMSWIFTASYKINSIIEREQK
jgi:hypothetical protein